MNLEPYFKSIVDQDRTSIVICDLSHTIIYMNPAAIRNYERRGGEALVGRNLLDCHNDQSKAAIQRVLAWFAEDADHNIAYTFYNPNQNKDVYMVALRGSDSQLIGYYEKHEYRDRETRKTYELN